MGSSVRTPVRASRRSASASATSTAASRLALWASVAAVSALAALAGTATGREAPSRAQAPQGAQEAVVALAALPPQARQTHALILSGGPFPYPHKDGTVFFNRERLLPLHPRGYYREYTVRTPGLSHRGARRIVCGGSQPTQPDACYYTADHYASFARIVQ